MQRKKRIVRNMNQQEIIFTPEIIHNLKTVSPSFAIECETETTDQDAIKTYIQRIPKNNNPTTALKLLIRYAQLNTDAMLSPDQALRSMNRELEATDYDHDTLVDIATYFDVANFKKIINEQWEKNSMQCAPTNWNIPETTNNHIYPDHGDSIIDLSQYQDQEDNFSDFFDELSIDFFSAQKPNEHIPLDTYGYYDQDSMF